MPWLLGSHSLKEAILDPENLYKILAFEFHPNWRNGSGYDEYDMALITLERRVQFSDEIRPICLPEINGEEAFYGRMGIVAGWGKVVGKIFTLLNYVTKFLEICDAIAK